MIFVIILLAVVGIWLLRWGLRSSDTPVPKRRPGGFALQLEYDANDPEVDALGWLRSLSDDELQPFESDLKLPGSDEKC